MAPYCPLAASRTNWARVNAGLNLIIILLLSIAAWQVWHERRERLGPADVVGRIERIEQALQAHLKELREQGEVNGQDPVHRTAGEAPGL